MPDRATRQRGRRLFLVIIGFAIFGALCVGAGVWGVLHTSAAYGSPRAWPGAGIVCGSIFIGFAAAELVRRLRRGPQQPGRHTN